MLFARITGVVDWVCPACNYINKSSLSPLKYTLRCNFNECSRTYYPGVILYMANSASYHRKTFTRDTLMVRKNTRHTISRNLTFCDSCGVQISSELVKLTDDGVLPLEDDPIPEDQLPISLQSRKQRLAARVND